MSPVSISLQRRVFQAVGLLWAAGCQPGKVSVEYDSGTYNPDDTGGSTGGGTGQIPDGYVDCGDVPELTEEMLLTGYVDSALLCQEVPDDGACPTVEAFAATEVLYETFELETMGWGYDVWATCGPDASRLDACCYEVSVSEWVEGRPYLVDGVAQTSTAGALSGWSDAGVCLVGPLAKGHADWLGAVWERSARYEHASVASFARVILELTSVGAPAALVADTAAAMQDEVRHAQQALSIARSLSPAVEGIGPMPLGDAVALRSNLKAMLRAVLREGAVGETLAAAEAAEAARVCGEPALRDVLVQVAEDEARHAALAWRTVRWILGLAPELRVELTAVERPTVEAEVTAGPPRVVRNRFGVLDAAQRQQVLEQTWARVVTPALVALGSRGDEAVSEVASL